MQRQLHGYKAIFLTFNVGLHRLFKTVDIPGTVLKRAPNFCTVYVVSKGKVSGLRNATRPVPARYAAGGALLVQRNSSVDLPTAM